MHLYYSKEQQMHKFIILVFLLGTSTQVHTTATAHETDMNPKRLYEIITKRVSSKGELITEKTPSGHWEQEWTTMVPIEDTTFQYEVTYVSMTGALKITEGEFGPGVAKITTLVDSDGDLIIDSYHVRSKNEITGVETEYTWNAGNPHLSLQGEAVNKYSEVMSRLGHSIVFPNGPITFSWSNQYTVRTKN